MPKLTINGHPVDCAAGTTILDAAQSVGFEIPTLCKVENFRPIGACRVCVVDVEGFPTLPAACSTPVNDGMVVRTNSPRAREARKSVVQLLLSEHNGDCALCSRSEDCELQALARSLGIHDQPYAGERTAEEYDDSTPAIRRNAGKCIKCRRCVTACNDIQGVGTLFPQGRGFGTTIGPPLHKPLSEVTCVQCGQCVAMCPVGALEETDHTEGVWRALADPTKRVVVQTAPAIRAALGECFGMPEGSRVTGKMVSALRTLGFHDVFDTNFAADLTIMEEGTELLTRLRTQSPALPLFTSCSPGWIRYAEQLYPAILPHISSCKSPQQMFGALAKTYYARKIGVDPHDMVVVSVMPCTAKKYEAGRPEMGREGYNDVDYVLTTRELATMVKTAGIDFRSLPDGQMDLPLGLSTGAADIFANTGGVMEAALRTVYQIVCGRSLPFADLHVAPIAGLEGVKEAAITVHDPVADWAELAGVTLRVAVAHGLSNAKYLVEQVVAGRSPYHFVEVMTCPGGCIGGGGQPRLTTDKARLARIAALYQEDESKELRGSHENPQIAQLYAEFLGNPLGAQSHQLLHTVYGGARAH